MIEKLRNCKNVYEVINEIKKFYSKYDNDYYIPAIYKEGSFLTMSKEDHNAEFYAKLIIRPINYKIEQTWLKQNLAYNFIDGSDKIDTSDYIYNLVVQKNYYQNVKYILNPFLYNDNQSYIYEKIQDSKPVSSLYYFNASFSTNEWPILIYNSDSNILLFKMAIFDYIYNYKNNYPQYQMSVEFEYRDKLNTIENFEVVKDEHYMITNERVNEFIWLLGTIDIDFFVPDDRSLDIITNQLNGNIRKINESNWNDDLDAGLIVFDKKCIKSLKKRYLFIELSIVDIYTKDSFLIDVLDDKVVFWEGEFNKLPFEVKKELEKFNIRKKMNGIISKPMFEWQLQGNLNYYKFEYPYQKIGKIIFEKYFDIAFEMRLSLELPFNKNELLNKINDLLKLFSLTFKQIYKKQDGYFKLQKIVNNEYTPKISELAGAYDYFCYLLLEVVEND